MSRTRLAVLPFATAIVLLWARQAAADVVELRDGSRIVGAIVHLVDGKLSIDTAFAGTIQIDWHEVTVVETEGELVLHAADGSVYRGRLRSEDRAIRVESSSAHVFASVPLAEAREIGSGAPEPWLRWHGSVDAGAELRVGNEDEQDIAVDADLLLKTEVGKGRFGLEVDREREDGDVDDSEIRGTIDMRRDLAPRIFASLAQLYEQDLSDGIRFRAGIVPGLGYRLFDRANASLTAETGVGYLHQRFEGGGEEDLPVGRIGVTGATRHFEGRLRADNELTAYGGLSSETRFLVRDEAQIRWRLLGPFNVGARLELQWASEAAPDIDEERVRFYFTLGYEVGDAALHW